jgi:hypothetical protein
MLFDLVLIASTVIVVSIGVALILIKPKNTFKVKGSRLVK